MYFISFLIPASPVVHLEAEWKKVIFYKLARAQCHGKVGVNRVILMTEDGKRNLADRNHAGHDREKS